MTELCQRLAAVHILPQLRDSLIPGQVCYLVGGALRDVLLGRPTNDFDFCTPSDPTPLARTFASRIRGKWFMLDPQRHQSRVVKKIAQDTVTYDFAPFRGASLAADLKLRDFTVNALAVDLTAVDGELLDPLSARQDLHQLLLRACSASVFQDDPLRVLRGVRLSTTLGMIFDAETFRLMKDAVPLLLNVAFERITNELIQIFAAEAPAQALDDLDQLGALPVLFGNPGNPDAFVRGAAQAKQVADRLRWFKNVPATPFAEFAPSDLALLPLAALFSGSGVLGSDKGLLKRMRLSRSQQTLLRTLVDCSAAQADDFFKRSARGRGRAILVEQLGATPGLVLLYLLCLTSRPDEAPCWIRDALIDYRTYVRDTRIPDLVGGDWLRSELDITDGSVIGRCLRSLRQAEIDGLVRTPEEAHKFLKLLAIKFIDKNADPS